MSFSAKHLGKRESLCVFRAFWILEGQEGDLDLSSNAHVTEKEAEVKRVCSLYLILF